jgi:cytochrome c oxidase subunit 2
VNLKSPTLRRLRPFALLASLGLVLSACGDDTETPLTTFDAKGPYAQDINNLAKPVFLVAGIVFVLVEVGVLFLVFRFRRRRNDEDGVDEPV